MMIADAPHYGIIEICGVGISGQAGLLAKARGLTRAADKHSGQFAVFANTKAAPSVGDPIILDKCEGQKKGPNALNGKAKRPFLKKPSFWTEMNETRSNDAIFWIE